MGLMTVLLKREISTRQMLSKETDNIFLNESTDMKGISILVLGSQEASVRRGQS